MSSRCGYRTCRPLNSAASTRNREIEAGWLLIGTRGCWLRTGMFGYILTVTFGTPEVNLKSRPHQLFCKLIVTK